MAINLSSEIKAFTSGTTIEVATISTVLDLSPEADMLEAAVSGTQAFIKLAEDTDNGANYVAIQPPAALSATYTITLPVDAGSSGQVLTTDGAGVTTWETPSGGLTFSQILAISTLNL